MTILSYDANLAYINYIVIGVYLLSMLAVGVYSGFSKGKESGTEEYFKASGKIPWWATGISIWATTLSAITYMSTPANSFTGTWAYAFGNITIFIFTPILIKMFLPFFKKLQVATAYEYLDQRYGSFMRLITSVLFMTMYIGRVGIIIYLPTLALSQVIPGANNTTFMFIIAISIGFICMLYTFIGGIRGVIWTDVIQGFVLLFGIIVVIFFALAKINFSGHTAASAAKIIGPKDWQVNLVNASIPLIFISQFINNAYQYVGSQDVVQRYNTSKTIKETKSGIWSNAWLSIITIFLFYGAGTLLYIFYQQAGNPNVNSSYILPYFIIQELPIGLSGLIIAGILAAAQSASSSGLNAISSCITCDIVEKFNPKIKDKPKMIVAKGSIWLAGSLAIIFAIMLIYINESDILNYYLSFIGLFGAPILSSYVLGIFTKRTSYVAISISIVIGFLCSLSVWILGQPAIINHPMYINPLYTSIVGFSVSTLLGYLLSFIFKNPENINLDNLTWYSLKQEDKIKVFNFDFKLFNIFYKKKEIKNDIGQDL